MIVKNRFRELLSAKALKEKRRTVPISEVERATNITWKTLQKWDLNRVNSFGGDTIASLCDYFDCEIGDLLYLAVCRRTN